VITTPRAAEQIRDRIERAYLRRRPEWKHAGLDPRLWVASAAILMDAHRSDPRIPLDPELFVACQTAKATDSDPWRELTRASSRRRYLACIRQIVLKLRRELRHELRRIRVAEKSGNDLKSILLGTSRSISPLGCYLAACLRNRTDLVELLREAARAQHEVCPLYREAALKFIPESDYPIVLLFPQALKSLGASQFSLN
jgi:hypothetical protein